MPSLLAQRVAPAMALFIPFRKLTMFQEIHIAGVVIHAHPDETLAIRSRIALIPNAEVHAASDDGRLVITLEADSTKRTLDYMDAIRALPGVMNVSLVYQHAEPAAAMDEEVEQ